MFDASSAAGTDSLLHTHTQDKHTHTLPGTRGLVFPAPVTFNEEERGVKGHGGQSVFFFFFLHEFLSFSLSGSIRN